MKRLGLIYNCIHMRKIFISLFAVLCFMVLSCDKEGPGDNYDLRDKVAPYVAFNNTSNAVVKEGETIAIPFVVRTAVQSDVDITLSISGVFNEEQMVTLPKGTMSVHASIVVPTGVIQSPDTTARATVSIVKAVAKDGTEFSLGSLNDPKTQQKILNITL